MTDRTPARPSVLVVEDDPAVVAILRRVLRAAGLAPEVEMDGARARTRVLEPGWDLVLLDIVLPGATGFEILAGLREAGSDVPVLLLTGQRGPEAIAAGLDAGADDYLEKPFNVVELQARCRALLRRRRPTPQAELTVGDLHLIPGSRILTVDGAPLRLEDAELELLELLMRTPARPVRRDVILRHVFGKDFDPGTQLVERIFERLRSQLEEAGAGARLRAVPPDGFMIGAP